MDILQREDMIKGLPDAVLFQKAQETGADQFLFVSEIQRRQKMRDSYAKSQSDQPEETIVEQILSGGIAEVGQPNEDMQAAMLSGMPPPQPQGPPMGMPPQGMPPQGPPMGMAPQGMPPQGMPMGMPTGMPMGMPTGMPTGMPPQGMPPQGMPMGMAPQGMASGGVVRMANTPHLLENQNHNVPVLVDKAGQPSMKLSSAITVDGKRGSLDRELLDLALADKTPTETVKRDVMANTPRQEMASGGVVRMAGGQGTPFTPTGRTVGEIAGSLYDYEPPTTRSMTTGVNPRGGLYPIDTVVPEAETQEELRDRILGTDWRLNRPDVANQYIHGTVGTHGWDDRDKFIEWAVDKESGKLAQYLPEDQQPVSGEDAADVVSTSETPTTVVNSTVGTSNENLAFDLGQKNVGRFLSALQGRPNGNSAVAANVSPLQLNQPLSYRNLAEKVLALKRPKGADLSEVRKTLLGQRTALETLQQNWPDKPKFDFKEHALDYGRLISEQESRARKIREDAKKSAGAQALIHLGAGIAEGDLAKGLRGAAESASETTRLGRQEATAEERLARTMQIAEAESKANLGIRQGEAAVALETAAQEMKHANS